MQHLLREQRHYEDEWDTIRYRNWYWKIERAGWEPDTFMVRGTGVDDNPLSLPYAFKLAQRRALVWMATQIMGSSPVRMLDYLIKYLPGESGEELADLRIDLLSRPPMWCVARLDAQERASALTAVRAYATLDTLSRTGPTPEIRGLAVESLEAPLPSLLILRDALTDAGRDAGFIDTLLELVNRRKRR